MELDYGFMIETFYKIWDGIGVTLGLTALSLLIALPISFYMAVIRLRGNKLGTGITRFYISFVRGTPLVLQILLMYSLLPSFLNFALKSMGSSFNIFESVNPFWYAVIVFSLNTIALLAEVFRSALMSIDKGQMEAGVSIGLSEWQTYRQIIIPQALVVALPAVSNITVNLIKGTSLAFLMTVKDVLAIGKIAASYGYNYIEAYLDVFVVYIIVCTIVQLVYRIAENESVPSVPCKESMPMLMSIKNVRKKFGGVEVLKDLNMEINKGDVVVILGPSGSGKTTFLRCLNFLERADEGQMEFADMNIDLSKPSDKEIAAVRKKTAFVFQGYNLFANKTVLENVMLGLTTGRGIPKAEAEQTARDALQRVA